MSKTLEKLPGETRQFCVDFSRKLRPGEVLLSLDQVQVEPHALTIDSDDFAVNGPKAFLTIGAGGVVDQTYVLIARATTNGSRTIESACRLRVIKPTPDLVVVQGDDYLEADGRQFQFQGGEEWPDLTDASIVLVLKSPFLAAELRVEGSVEEAEGTAKTVWVEVTSDQTAELPAGGYRYDVEATIDGVKHTLRCGYAIVREDQST